MMMMKQKLIQPNNISRVKVHIFRDIDGSVTTQVSKQNCLENVEFRRDIHGYGTPPEKIIELLKFSGVKFDVCETKCTKKYTSVSTSCEAQFMEN